MNQSLKLFTTLFCLLIFTVSNAQNNKAITEYLNIPGPLSINNNKFNLAWSSHPSAAYYKQEYIDPKEKLERFSKMILVEVLISDAKPADLAKAKMDELKLLKTTNPLVNYEMFQKNGEIIIDFLISENSRNGKVSIIERNVYRYRAITVKKGLKAVMLFAVSERAYGNDVDSFLSSLKKNKSTLLNAVAGFTIPPVSLKE